jgi:hypothetical protein
MYKVYIIEYDPSVTVQYMVNVMEIISAGRYVSIYLRSKEDTVATGK